MKFNNKLQYFFPQQASFIKVEPKKVTISDNTLTLSITSPCYEVIRVVAYKSPDYKDNAQGFELNASPIPLTVDDGNSDSITIYSGRLSLEIGTKARYMCFRRGDNCLTESDSSDLALIQGDSTFIRQQLGLDVDEKIYGLGGLSTPITKNGQSIDISYSDSRNIPFYVSTKGYGIFVNHTQNIGFEVGTDPSSKVGFSANGDYLDYFFINGPIMKKVLERYTQIAGSLSLPIHCSLGSMMDYRAKEESLRSCLSLSMSGCTDFTIDFKNDTEEAVPDMADKLKEVLAPYIAATTIAASTSGVPVMRSMALEFANDRTCHHLDKQFMIGESLLVAPSFSSDGKAQYYLPKGVWTSYLTGKEYTGGVWVTEKSNDIGTALMVRENSIIATNTSDSNNVQRFELCVYAIHDGIYLDTVVFNSDNTEGLRASVKRLGHSIHVTAEGALPYSIRMVNMYATDAENGFISVEGNDSVIVPDNGANMIEIKF
jgi:alpha-glucosidase (family GH31 glycosyl hydrolase)